MKRKDIEALALTFTMIKRLGLKVEFWDTMPHPGAFMCYFPGTIAISEQWLKSNHDFKIILFGLWHEVGHAINQGLGKREPYYRFSRDPSYHNQRKVKDFQTSLRLDENQADIFAYLMCKQLGYNCDKYMYNY